MRVAKEDASPDVSLTSYGLDSLSTASLSFALRPIVAISQLQLLADLTVKDLLARVVEAGDTSSAEAPPTVPTATPELDLIGEKIREMEALVSQLSAGFVPLPAKGPSQRDTLGSVVVTGTTGSLGAHVLAQLLEDSGFRKVYALIRPGSGEAGPKERQISAFEHRGLDVSLLESSRFVAADCALDKPLLGMDNGLYEEVSLLSQCCRALSDRTKIRTSVSHIVHLGQLSTHMDGLRH